MRSEKTNYLQINKVTIKRNSRDNGFNLYFQLPDAGTVGCIKLYDNYLKKVGLSQQEAKQINTKNEA